MLAWGCEEELVALEVLDGSADRERSMTLAELDETEREVEIGDQDAGQRATYGASPGDHAHDEPYLYVGAWGEVDRSDPFWNESNFNGASLPYSAIVEADDQFGVALDFLRSGLSKLAG